MKHVLIILFIFIVKFAFSIVDPTCLCGNWDYNQLDKAIARIDSTIRQHADSSDLYYLKGYYIRCYCVNQRKCNLINSAILSQKKAISLNNKNYKAFEELGEVFLNDYDSTHYNLDSSLYYFSNAKKINSNSGNAFTGIGKIYIKLGKYEDAFDSFMEGIANKNFCKLDDYLGLIQISFLTHNLQNIENYYPSLYLYTDGENQLNYIREALPEHIYEKFIKSDKTFQDEIYQKLVSLKNTKTTNEIQMTKGFLFDILNINYFKEKPELMKIIKE